MSHSWLLHISAGLLLSGSSGASGRAATLDCLWDNIPVALRESLYIAYDQAGLEGLDAGGIDDSGIERIHGVCVRRHARASTGQLRATGTVLVGIVLAKSAAHRISKTDPAAPSRMLHVWRALPEADRQQLRSMFLGGNDETMAAAKAILGKAARLASEKGTASREVRDAALLRDYVNFFLGMAQAEAFLDAL